MKACVMFRDGTSSDLDLPEDMRHVAEITTGRTDRMENVTARFSHWDTRGAVFVETQPTDVVPAKETLH